jgi:hypothetical protein
MSGTYISQNGFGTPVPFANWSYTPQFAGPQFAAPQFAAPQFAPQGLFGSLLGSVAPVIGGAVGGNAGRWINTIGSGIGHLLPFEATPFQTGGYPTAGYPTAGYPTAGYPTAGYPTAANFSYAPQFAGPQFAAPQFAAPQFAPQGLFGSLLGTVAPVLGGAVGGNAGRWINTIGSGIGHLLPFQATPWGAAPTTLAATPSPFYTPYAAQNATQFAPQGLFGNIVSNVVPAIGGAVSNAGQLISSLGQNLGQILPFSATPWQSYDASAAAAPYYAAQNAAQFAPQGLFGNILGTVAPVIGNALGGNAGRWINTIGNGIGHLLPFDAAPASTAAAYNPAYSYIPVQSVAVAA